MEKDSVIHLKTFSKKEDGLTDKKSPTAPDSMSEPVQVAQGAGQKILVIEDDDFLRGLFTTKLKKAGYQATGAPAAERGLELMRLLKPDLILLDLMLPGMSGFEFLSERNAREGESIKTIVLSNLGSKNDVDHAMGLGAVDYMIKANFTLDGILERVASHLADTK